jgi:hypothetical protein
MPKTLIRSLNLHLDFFAFPAACHKSSLPQITNEFWELVKDLERRLGI